MYHLIQWYLSGYYSTGALRGGADPAGDDLDGLLDGLELLRPQLLALLEVRALLLAAGDGVVQVPRLELRICPQRR